MGRRDLFISAFAPTMGSGRALRTYTTVRAMAERRPVDFAYIPFESDGPDAMYAAIEGVDYHPIFPSRGARRAAVYLSRRIAGYQDGVARGASPEIIGAYRRLRDTPDRGRVVAGDMTVMCSLMKEARRHPVIYNTHNIESTPEHDINHGKPVWLPMAVTERRILRRAAETWIVSPNDLHRARALAPSSRMRYAPNVVDVTNIPLRDPPMGGRVVLMVADFTYSQNATALRWLLDDILPRVWERLPETRLRLVGRGLEEEPIRDARVDALGYVDALGPAYADAAAVAVPLVGGGGTSLKFLEAMAYGVPVVSTSSGARGLLVVDGEHFREAEGAAPFADALVDVLTHGAPAMAARARELAEREYSVETLARLLDPEVPAPAVAA